MPPTQLLPNHIHRRFASHPLAIASFLLYDIANADIKETLTDTVVDIKISEFHLETHIKSEVDGTKSEPAVIVKHLMYDINTPPDWSQQFAMFPKRSEANLAYILVNMEGSSEYVPIVFCTDCAATKWHHYCNGVWEYQYEPCLIDKDFYCPKFYAELLRRFSTQPSGRLIGSQLSANPKISHKHANGCIHSSAPEYIIQGKEGLARSIYLRHCGGEFKNAMMKTLDMESTQGDGIVNASSWLRPLTVLSADRVPGLEWKETPKLQSLISVEGITHL